MIFHAYLSRWIKAERKQRNLSQESMSKPLCVSTYPARHYRYSCLWYWNLQKLCRGQISLSSVNYSFSLFIFPGCWDWDSWGKAFLRRPIFFGPHLGSSLRWGQHRNLGHLAERRHLPNHIYGRFHIRPPLQAGFWLHNKDTEISSDFPIFPRSFRQ